MPAELVKYELSHKVGYLALLLERALAENAIGAIDIGFAAGEILGARFVAPGQGLKTIAKEIDLDHLGEPAPIIQ